MPITINGTTDARIGFMQTSLDGLSVDFDGTFTQVGSVVGSMNPTLGGLTVSFQGQYSDSASFDGDMNLALGGISVNFIGNQIQNIDGLMSLSLGGLTVSFQDSSVLEADWQLRISQPGVVWYHDFRSEDEVNAFRWAGGVGNDPNDVGKPNTIVWQPADGITGGGCLEAFRPTGSTDGAVWWRPFSPLNTGSGKTVSDPGANGTITVQPYAPTQGGSQIANWDNGWYGHPNYQDSTFDGHDYWFQARVKMDSRRTGQADGGKLFYFTRTDQSLTSQEIVTVSGQDGNVSGFNFFDMYRSGSPPLSSDDPGSENQVGNESGTCDWPSQISACWAWSGDWDTVLYHVRPGLNSNSDTLVAVYAAHPGETSYTKIWDQDNVNLPFDVKFGHNAVICSGYMNGLFLTEFYHRWDQLIFSKDPVSLPRSTPTTLQAIANEMAVGDVQTLADNTLQDKWDIQWVTATTYYDPIRREIQYMGKAASGQSHATLGQHAFTHYVYNENLNLWQEPNEPAFYGTPSSGHIWCHAFDHLRGNYYCAEYSSETINKFDPITQTWSQLPTAAAGGIELHPSTNTAAILAWHPNLFGPGRPGLYGHGMGRALAFNPETNAWVLVQDSTFAGGSAFRDRNNGEAIYCPGPDIMVLFGQSNATPDHALHLHAGAGNASNVVSEGYLTSTGTSPPFLVAGKGDGVQTGKVINHPEDPNRLILLEYSGSASGSGDVYESDDFGVTWVKRTSGSHPGRYLHPFDNMSSSSAGAFTIGCLPLHKCIIGISSSDGPQGEIKIWRPGL